MPLGFAPEIPDIVLVGCDLTCPLAQYLSDRSIEDDVEDKEEEEEVGDLNNQRMVDVQHGD